MSILSAFTSGVRAAAGDAGAIVDSPLWGDRYFGGGWFSRSASGMRVTPGSAKQLPVVYACVAKKATAIAMLPFKIYQDDGKGGSKVARQHPLYDVLYSRPNHLQTAFEFKQMLQAHVELRGNAYAEIIPGPRGAVDQLMPMHPDRVRVEQLQGSGRLRYRYQDPLTNTERVLMQEEVFHLRELPDVVGVGQSRIAAGAELMGLGLLMQDYRARFMRNDATPGVVFTGNPYKKREDEDAFIDSVKAARTGENRGRPYLLPPGMDMKTMAVTPVEQQLLEAMKLTDQQICSMFNVLPHTVGIDTGKAATFASTEQFNLMHVQQCVLPMAIMWEQAIQRCLITSPMYYAKASLASMMRGDAATRGKFYQLLISSGVVCPDEVRELEDMNPIPDGSGKRFWNPLNWGLLNRTPALSTGAVRPGASAGEDDSGEMEGEDDQLDPGESDDPDPRDQARLSRRESKLVARAVEQTIQTLVEHQRWRAA